MELKLSEIGLFPTELPAINTLSSSDHMLNSPQDNKSNAPLNGISFALLAFMGFPISDAIMKSMTGDWPAAALVAVRFAMGAAGLSLLLLKFEGLGGFQVGRAWLHVARGFVMAIAAASFISAIFIMPLADAVAITFVSPIITALLSSWFLDEKMRPVTWLVTFIAFAGVLIMLRPNVAAFGWSAVLPLVAAAAMAAVMILNRMVSSQRSIIAAQFYGAFWTTFFMAIIAIGGHFLVPTMEIVGQPSTKMLVLCAVVAVLNTGCHFLLYIATMRATAAAIAPVVYVQLVVSSLISVYIFGDSMDPVAMAGGALIVLSGLIMWRSERKIAAVVRA